MQFPQGFFAATRDYNTYEKHVPAPYIRKRFSLPRIARAELLVTGLGFYDLFLNGERITKGLLAPYISNPDDIVYFDRYDVTAQLHEGANAVGLLLGNGMQNAPGGRVWDFDVARFRAAPCFALSLCCTTESGERITLEADETFRAAPSPILFDDLRSGVFYDANKAMDGWSTPDFDDSARAYAPPLEECPDTGYRFPPSPRPHLTGFVKPLHVPLTADQKSPGSDEAGR